MDYFFISYGLTLIAFIISIAAQVYVNSSYKKYSRIKNERGITGKEAARYILDKHGLSNIKVEPARGFLSDHYDPRNNVIKLSESNYNGYSIASVAVACHECGHAIQDKEGYFFMKIRSSIVPIVNFSSYAGYIAIVLGCLFGAINLIWLGIIAEIVILLFQLITLPVEFDASKRAKEELTNLQLIDREEYKGVSNMLKAAAFTYVAGVLNSLLQLLRLIIMLNDRRD